MLLVRGTNHLKAFAALVIVAVLLDSSLLVSAALPQEHLNQGTQPTGVNPVLQFASPLGPMTFAGGEYHFANMTTRGEIMAFVLTNPGVYMREVSEDLGLSMGVVQYHIWVLSKNGKIEECRSGRYRRFFGAAKYGEVERRIISLMRQGTAGRILALLSDGQPLQHMKLAEQLGLSSQALTWHMKRLNTMGIVETGIFQGMVTRAYRLVDGVAQTVRLLSVAKATPSPSSVQVPVIR